MRRTSSVIASALLAVVSFHVPAVAATITWTGIVDDSWHTPGNWDLNRVPAVFDDVVIPDLAGTEQVRHTTGTTSIRTLNCSENLVVSGGVLSMSVSSSASKLVRIENGATMTVNGDFLVHGTFSFAEGTLSGAGTTSVDSTFAWEMATEGPCVLNRFLVLNGDGVQGPGDVTVGSLKSLRIKSGAEYLATGRLLGPGTVINESGAVIRNTIANGVIDCSLQNSGTIRVESGDLVLNNFNGLGDNDLVRGRYDLSGTLEIPAPFDTNSATIILRGAEARLIDGSGADVLRSLKINEGLLQVSSGNSQSFDSLTVNRGVLRSDLSAVLSLPMGCTQTAGRIELSNGSLVLPFLNMSGGLILGSGNIVGNVTNGGSLYPGDAPGVGLISIQGEYTQTAAGRLLIDITGAGFDQLQVAGVAHLSGLLQITPSSGYAPGPTDIYPFLTAADVDLGFTAETLPLTLHPNDCPALYYQLTSVSYRVFYHTQITSQPQSQVVCGGSPASLSVTALHGVNYQWRQNGVAVSGANSSVLNLPSLMPSQAGSYDVIVVGACTAETSDVAVLTYRNCVEPSWNSVWLGGSGQLPDPGCWNGFDNASPEQPTLVNGTLTLATSAFTENMYYIQSSTLAVPNNLFIGARIRFVSEAHIEGNPRRGVAINFSVAPDSSNRVFIGRDSVYIWSSFDVMGPPALVDTDGAFHDYLIQVVNHRDIYVYQDDILILAGAVTVNPLNENVPVIWWGDGTDATRGVSEWQFVKHNANTTVCGPTTITWTGAVSSSWHTAGNWDRNRVPGFGDNVVIPDLPGTNPVLHSLGTTVIDRLAASEGLSLAGGTIDIANASSSSNNLVLANGTLTGNGNLDITGNFTWQSGTMSGTGTTTVRPGVSWTAATSGNCLLTRTLMNQGSLTRNASGHLFTVNLPGLFRNASGSICALDNNNSNFTGSGQFMNETGALLHNRALSSTISCGITNTGIVRVNSGTSLQLTNLNDLIGGTLSGGGTYDLKGTLTIPGSVLENRTSIILSGGGARLFDGSGDALRNLNRNLSSGSIRISLSKVQSFNAPVENGGFIQIDSAGVATFNAGLLQTGGETRINLAAMTVSPDLTLQDGVLTGRGTITGNVVNDATVSTGLSPGRLRIEGNYTQTSGAAWLVELAGLTAATQYDQLQVVGAATLAGSLTVSNINGFVPAPGDSFQILTSGSRTGTFTNVTLPAQPVCFNTLYGPSGVTLAACPVGGVGPDPGASAGPLSMSMAPSTNPARGVVRFTVTSSRDAADATLKIFNTAGGLVRRLDASHVPSGVTYLNWDGRDAHGVTTPRGLYFVVLECAGRSMASAKVVILR